MTDVSLIMKLKKEVELAKEKVDAANVQLAWATKSLKAQCNHPAHEEHTVYHEDDYGGWTNNKTRYKTCVFCDTSYDFEECYGNGPWQKKVEK